MVTPASASSPSHLSSLEKWCCGRIDAIDCGCGRREIKAVLKRWAKNRAALLASGDAALDNASADVFNQEAELPSELLELRRWVGVVAANVSSRLMVRILYHHQVKQLVWQRFLLCMLDQCSLEHQQTRRRESALYALNADQSINLARVVVVVAAVLGSKTVDLVVTQNFITHGMRAFKSAQRHGGSSKQSSASS